MSGYRVNRVKSAMMGIIVSDGIKRKILKICQSVWCKRIKFLCIVVLNTAVVKDWLDSNLTLIITQTVDQFKAWGKLRLSWFGCIAAIKLKVLPRFLYLIQHLYVPIPTSTLQTVQRYLFGKVEELELNFQFYS